MEVEFELTEEDLIAYTVYEAKRQQRTPAARWQRWGTFILVSATLAGLTVFRFFQKGPEGSSMTFVGLMLGLVGIFYLIVLASSPIQRSLLVKETRKKLQQGRNVLLLAKRRLSLADDCCSEVNAFGTKHTPWTVVPRIEVTADYAFIYVTEDSAHILPRRAFSSEVEFKAFVEVAQRYHSEAGLQKWSKDGPEQDTDQRGVRRGAGEVDTGTQPE